MKSPLPALGMIGVLLSWTSPALPNDLPESEQISVAEKWLLLDRVGEAEKVLRKPKNAQAKAMRAILIWKDDENSRLNGLSTFDRFEAERLAKEASPLLKQQAVSDSISANLYGVLLARGLGIPRDEREAFRLFSDAAGKGNVAAMYNLSFSYFDGEGVSKDHVKGLNWLRKAADAGDTRAMCSLAKIYQIGGDGIPLSLSSALYFLELAAKRGNASAMYECNDWYSYGSLRPSYGLAFANNGETPNPLKAAADKWLLQSADSGYIPALAELAYRYEVGKFGPVGFDRVGIDLKKSFEYRKRAASTGLPSTIAHLARSYRYGIGCDKDEREAERIFEKAKAATKGDKNELKRVENIMSYSPFADSGFPPSTASKPSDAEEDDDTLSEPDTTPLPEPKAKKRSTQQMGAQAQEDIPTGSKIVLLDVVITPTGIGDAVYIEGRVKNISDESLERVHSSIVLESRSRGFLGNTTVYVTPDPIPPGAVGSFKGVDMNHPDIAHVTLDFMTRGDKSIIWVDRSGKRAHP